MLVVLLCGSPLWHSYFSIADVNENTPMIKRHDGHYYGEYAVSSEGSLSAPAVTVYMTDKFGRTTEGKIGYSGVATTWGSMQ